MRLNRLLNVKSPGSGLSIISTNIIYRSLRIGMAKGMPSTSLQDWKAITAPLLLQKRRWYDAGGFPYRSACMKQPRYAPGCLYPSRWLLWLRRCAQRTQVYLKRMIIRVNLQFLCRRLNQYNRKLSELDIAPKIVTKITSEVNNVSSSATLTQVV
ncbi:Hypothetical_protein [Hexamita inflata]|uniref:Hypothetical_protein n=1 Tax=Hexamita inflata TaxID=28002 RepID=A0AA86RTF7_9EUKA|nr:Hypothetical protein HINF_LOCUS65407 [Hexamita inflata]CAI9977765.1 Hypothetical protein HINF_LOCUS65410 [Hexamita inflata]